MGEVELTVIVPCFNVEKYVARCIESILDQNYKNYELIILDDCSSDSTREIISRYDKLDKRIRSVFLDVNSGPSIARQVGIDMAKGRFLMFMDSDDRYISKNALGKMVARMNKTGADCVSSRYQIYYNKLLTLKRGPVNMKHMMKSSEFAVLKMKKPKFHWHYIVTRCYKLSIIRENNIRFEPSLIFKEDIKFNNDYLLYAKHFDYIPDCIYEYNCSNQASITKNREKTSLKSQTDWFEKAKIRYKETKKLYATLKVYEKCSVDIAGVFYDESIRLIRNLRHSESCSELKVIIENDQDFIEAKSLLGYRANIFYINQCIEKRVRKVKNWVVSLVNRVLKNS